MKNRYFGLLAALMLLVGSSASAQYWYVPYLDAGQNPGGLNAESDAGYGSNPEWTLLLGPTVSTPAWSDVQTLPFPFEFAGAPVSEFKVSSNGVLTFSTTASNVPPEANEALPSANIPDSSILVWGLKADGSNDHIMMKTFGTAPNRQLWVTLGSMSVPNTSTDYYVYWSMVLEEGTNNIYFVDQRAYSVPVKLTVGVQVDQNTSTSLKESPNVSFVATSQASDDNAYYTFYPGSRPAANLELTSFDTYHYQLLSNGAVEFEGTIRNLGGATVNSFDLNYSVNGGATITETIDNLYIPTLSSQSFTIQSNPWIPSSTGEYNVELWITAVNDKTDTIVADNSSDKVFGIFDNSTDRLPLYEVFTSSTCNPCRPGNIQLHSVLDNYSNGQDFALIKYQVHFPGTGDPYFTMEGYERFNYYEASSAPTLVVNGGMETAPNSWYGNPSIFETSDYLRGQSLTSFATMDLAAVLEANQTVSIDVDVNPLVNWSASDFALFVAIVEKKTEKNIKSNGEREFHYVMKKMLPDGEGLALSDFQANEAISEEFEYTFKGDYRLPKAALDPNSGNYIGIDHSIEHSVEEFTDLAVVAWVQDMNNGEVWQSVVADVTTGTGIDEHQAVAKMVVVPNPVENQATLQLDLVKNEKASIQIISVDGKVMQQVAQDASLVAGSHSFRLNTQELAPGMYFVRVQTKSGASQTKFVVAQ